MAKDKKIPTPKYYPMDSVPLDGTVVDLLHSDFGRLKDCTVGPSKFGKSPDCWRTNHGPKGPFEVVVGSDSLLGWHPIPRGTR